MSDNTQRPQIDSAKLKVGGGIAGAIFTIGSLLVFLTGIPVLRYVFPIAILVGCGVAVLLHFIHHETPGAPWLLPAAEKQAGAASNTERSENPDRSAKVSLIVASQIDFSGATS